MLSDIQCLCHVILHVLEILEKLVGLGMMKQGENTPEAHPLSEF